MNIRERRALKKLMQDPDRWWQTDMQRKEWVWKGIRFLSYSALASCAIITLGIWVQTHGGN